MKIESGKWKIKGENEMKNYINPEIEIIELSADDIITTSPGTETTPKDEPDGIWDLSH